MRQKYRFGGERGKPAENVLPMTLGMFGTAEPRMQDELEHFGPSLGPDGGNNRIAHHQSGNRH